MTYHYIRTDGALRTRLARYVLHERLCDREIAALEGVSACTVLRWRHVCGLDKTDFFARRFDARHGPGALARVRRLLAAQTPYATIALQLGCSREYVRQIRNRLTTKT